jgi:HAD superfamily hydrolase (TIGR01459 family)
MCNPVPFIHSLDEIAGRYAAVLCDVWGVVHNGVRPFPGAPEALRRARDRGIAVVLVTNAARLRGEVEDHLRTLGVPDDAWSRVVTSGDVTRELLRTAPRRIFHLGLDRDLALYEGLDLEPVGEAEAEAVVCTGLRDEAEAPDDYGPMLRRLRRRDLPFICANPDIFFERGSRKIWCAGALARDYAGLGGRVVIAGKPHAPIYEAALRAASEVVGHEVGAGAALAIGDGILTDVAGAAGRGIDVLYVCGGIHAGEYGEALDPDPIRLAAFLARHGHRPTAIIPSLR